MPEASLGRVIIAGAGIGGLTAAIGLRRAGFEVVVCERAEALRPVGAAIVLAPNAILALRRLGVDEAIDRAGQRGRRLTIRTARGEVISTSAFDALEAQLGAPMVTFHRAELHAALLEALGNDTVRLGACQAVVDAVVLTEELSAQRRSDAPLSTALQRPAEALSRARRANA